MNFRPFADLVFAYMPGCEACEAAEPEVDKFSNANPGMMVLKVRADGPIAIKLLGKPVKVTPTYVLRRGGEGTVHEGALKAKDIERWISQALGEDA
jgi:hypothetical protein